MCELERVGGEVWRMGVEEGTGAERMAVRESHGPTVARAKVKKNIFVLEN